MRLKSLCFAGLLVTTAPATAATLQEQYNSAQAAFDAGRMEEARAGFAAVLPRLDGNPRTKTQAAIVRARLGSATFKSGDAEAAAGLLAKAVEDLPAGGDDWQAALLYLGQARENAIEYDEAAVAYRRLLATPGIDAEGRLGATVGLVRVLMFSDPAAARTYADGAIAQAATLKAVRRGDLVAQLQMLRGRIELNAGKPADARVWLDKAVTSAGGLGSRVNAADLRVRGDLAIAAFLAGETETARRYFAFTGAGGLPDQGFEFGADMPLPQCAPAGAVDRKDMAIVEFSLAEDGRVSAVSPIYVSRTGGPELEFARAVRRWSWQPDAAKALPAFWRQVIRMELRCVSGDRESSSGWGVGRQAFDWMSEHAPEPMPETLRGQAAAMPVLRAEQARREAAFGAASPQVLPVLYAIVNNEAATPAEVIAAATRGMEIARGSSAPLDIVLFFRLREATARADAAGGRSRSANRRYEDRSAAVRALLAQFDAEGHGATRGAALAAATVALHAAWSNKLDVAGAAYRRILATPLSAMPDTDPLRQVARLQLASMEAEASRLDSARSLLAATGLSPDQCALFPVEPVLARANVGSNNFPQEVMRWGFEGTTRVAFDIDQSGRPLGTRTVIASPPLIFDQATERTAANFRFKPIFRDGAAIGCSDMIKGVRWRIQR